ncbi:cation:proton antiporter [soil metagenome]
MLYWSAMFAFGALSLSLLLAMFRLFMGPTLPDRVVALDLIAFVAVGVTVLFAIVTGQPAFLDAAVTLALIAFVGTVAFARYTEHSSDPRLRDSGIGPSTGGADKTGARRS